MMTFRSWSERTVKYPDVSDAAMQPRDNEPKETPSGACREPFPQPFLRAGVLDKPRPAALYSVLKIANTRKTEIP